MEIKSLYQCSDSPTETTQVTPHIKKREWNTPIVEHNYIKNFKLPMMKRKFCKFPGAENSRCDARPWRIGRSRGAMGGRGGGVTGGRIILHQRHNGDVCDKCRKMTSTGNVRGINPGKERADIKQKQRLLPLKDKQRIPAVPALSLGGPSITFIRKKKV